MNTVKTLHSEELVFLTGKNKSDYTLLVLEKLGRVRKIADGIYTPNFKDKAEDILARNKDLIEKRS